MHSVLKEHKPSMRSMHPMLILHLLTTEIRNLRWLILARWEEKQELEEQDNIWPEELPTSGTMSGWMRNENEARKYEQELLQKRV